MRNFTKQHNDITWLFPDIINQNNKEISEEWFDVYENRANYLLNILEINESNNFTKDDLIDAFMKGASTAQQMLTEYYSSKLDSLKTYNDVKKFIEDFNNRFKNGFYDKKK